MRRVLMSLFVVCAMAVSASANDAVDTAQKAAQEAANATGVLYDEVQTKVENLMSRGASELALKPSEEVFKKGLLFARLGATYGQLAGILVELDQPDAAVTQLKNCACAFTQCSAQFREVLADLEDLESLLPEEDTEVCPPGPRP